MNRHLLTLADWSRDEVRDTLALAARIKTDPSEFAQALTGRTLAMIFQKPSTRTRVSFQVAMQRLGGQAIYLSATDLQLGRGETVADTGKVLSRYVHAIMARVYAQSDLVELAQGTVPVINGLSDQYHPCQALADLLTLREHLGGLQGKVLAYLGDGTNVVHSLMLAGAHTGVVVQVACPEARMVDAAVVARARELGGQIEVGSDPVAAVRGAHAVYTDTWVSMHTADPDESAFEGFQVNAELMAHARLGAVFMHCLPAHRNHEVTDEVLDGPHSVVLDQAENRMWVQMAILLRLL